MFGPRVKISPDTRQRIKEAVEKAGYSSVDEFIQTAIERELERINSDTEMTAGEEEKVRERLRGLGYIK